MSEDAPEPEMTEKEKMRAFHRDLSCLIQRYALEFDLPVSCALGVLEVKKYEIIQAADEELNNADLDDDDEDSPDYAL